MSERKREREREREKEREGGRVKVREIKCENAKYPREGTFSREKIATACSTRKTMIREKSESALQSLLDEPSHLRFADADHR